jgi:hypothetical protein
MLNFHLADTYSAPALLPACLPACIQGIQAWVVVKSPRGEPVGAVQLSAAITHLNGGSNTSLQPRCMEQSASGVGSTFV